MVADEYRTSGRRQVRDRCEILARSLDAFPRLRFGHLPTPLESMDRLSAHLGGPRIWVKRDDCTGLSSGGNKTRKLEFLMAEALEIGANSVITQGATQSNHARQTAAAAAKLGLECHILLEDRIGSDDPATITTATSSWTGCTAPRSRNARAAPTWRPRWRRSPSGFGPGAACPT